MSLGLGRKTISLFAGGVEMAAFEAIIGGGTKCGVQLGFEDKITPTDYFCGSDLFFYKLLKPFISAGVRD